MLSAQGLTAGEAMRRSAAPEPAAPTDPMQDDASKPSVTITDNGDGTYSCDDGSGTEPSTHGSLEEAMDYAKSTLGGGEPDMDDMGAEPPAKTAAPPSDNTDLAGMYAKK